MFISRLCFFAYYIGASIFTGSENALEKVYVLTHMIMQ